MNLEIYKLLRETEKLIKKNEVLDKEIEELTKQLITKKVNLNIFRNKGDC